MNNSQLEEFLLKARSNTYAGSTGKSEALLPGSVQYEFTEGKYLYRDVYYLGNGIFPGIETVFYQSRPVWSMSYYGNFSKMTEEEVDKMLRKALLDNRYTTRTYRTVEKDYGTFLYKCVGEGTFDELSGREEIISDEKLLYFFNYAGGRID